MVILWVLLIIFPLLLIILGITRVSVRRIPFFKEKKMILILFGVYSSILVISSIVFEFLPESEARSGDVIRVSPEEQLNIEQAIFDGRLDEIDEDIIQTTFKEEFSDKSLNISLEHNLDYFFPIIVENTDAPFIEALYLQKVVFDGIDFTKDIQPVTFSLKDNTLHLKISEYTEIKTIHYKNNMIYNQFKNEEKQEDDTSDWDIRFIYLKIPNDVTIENEQDINIIYKGEIIVE